MSFFHQNRPRVDACFKRNRASTDTAQAAADKLQACVERVRHESINRATLQATNAKLPWKEGKNNCNSKAGNTCQRLLFRIFRRAQDSARFIGLRFTGAETSRANEIANEGWMEHCGSAWIQTPGPDDHTQFTQRPPRSHHFRRVTL
jgi:hypothetical protein